MEQQAVSEAGPEVEDAGAAGAAGEVTEEVTDAESEFLDPLHIGNTVEIISDTYGYTAGRVVFRDGDMVRVMPQEVSDRAVEFTMTDGGLEFSDDLGVKRMEVITTYDSDYYVDFLGAKVGETLEFFTADGQQAAPNGVVAEVQKNATSDNIVLEDGRVFEFEGRGPPAPIAVIRVRTAVNAAAAVEEGAPQEEGPVADRVAAAKRQTDVLALLDSILPSGAMEEIPMSARGFPDSLQREDLFQDLLENVKPKQRKQTRVLRQIEREVDVVVALKNTVASHDAAGRVTGVVPNTVETLQEAILASPGAVGMAIPIVAAARVLNMEVRGSGMNSYKESDVSPRILYEIEHTSENTARLFDEGAMPAAMGKGFSAYTYDLFSRDQVTLTGVVSASGWRADQDVMRTNSLDTPVQGFGATLPKVGDKEAPPVSVDLLEANVQNRVIRVITGDFVTGRRGGSSSVPIAPSDPDTITGWTILPPKAALRLKPPTNPCHLPTAILYTQELEDATLPSMNAVIQTLYSVDISPETIWTLKRAGPGSASASASAAASNTDNSMPIAEWLAQSLKPTIHPSDSLAPRTPALLGLQDVLGLSNRDLAPSVAEVLNKWVLESQQLWRRLFKAKREQVRTLLKERRPRVFNSVTGDDSPVWAALRQAAALKDVLADAKRRNPTIYGAPLVVAATLLTEAQGDAQPLVWTTLGSLESRDVGIDTVTAQASLSSSRAYHLRRAALRGAALLGLHAEPEINSCVHVQRLEGIRGIDDVAEQARMLREFVDEFQGGKNGDWVTCALCQQNCVCYHELMELEALAQPTRGDAIHRQVMTRFGGDRYEGKIICRNCGQALQDIDYDDHVEFDDNGRPIVEASVLTEEQLEEVPTESTWRKATAALTAAPLSFATESQRELNQALTTILELGGMIADESVVRQIVRYSDLYVSTRAPTQAAYDAQRTKLLTAASTRMKSAGAGAVPDVPTYAAVLDQLRVSALMAITGIALQMADPPIQVNNPFPPCRFSRGGWPLDAEAKPEDVGTALYYVACVTASLARSAAPWRNVAWAHLDKLDARVKKAHTTAIQAAKAIMGADPKVPQLSFTPEIRTAITRIQTDAGAAKERARVTVNDRLPAGFRPEPNPPSLAPPAPEGSPVNAAASVAAEGKAAPEAVVDSVAHAVRQQAISAIATLHAEAVAGSGALVGTKQNESVCCPVSFADADAGLALLGRKELAPLLAAARMLQGAQPAVSRAGTHLWVAEESHAAAVVEPVVDPGLLFQLFLRYCYTGSQVGEAHQFSTGNLCRQCGLVLGGPPELVDVVKDGAAILAAQQGDLRVEPSPAAFEALSDAVRRRKLLVERIGAVRPSWRQNLDRLAAQLTARPSHQTCGEALTAVLAAMSGAEELEIDEVGRATMWGPVAELMDAHRKMVADAIGPLQPAATGPRARTRAKEAVQALAMFDTITEDPFVEGPRAIREYWCAKLEAGGRNFGVRETAGAVWDALSSEHVERINGLLRANTDWYPGDITGDMRLGLAAVGDSLGPVMRLWTHTIHMATAAGPWTIAEARLLLRCLVLHSWADAVTGSSWMYRSIGAPGERATAADGVSDWTRSLMGHVKMQFLRFSKERVAQILQQRAELERTSIVEEFQSIKDDDERAAELIKKQLRMGRWGVAAKGWNKYDPELYEFENEQRKRMGIVDAPVDPSLLPAGAGAGADAFGFGPLDGAPEEGYDVDLGAAGDDY